jgi:hypothetical protein
MPWDMDTIADPDPDFFARSESFVSAPEIHNYMHLRVCVIEKKTTNYVPLSDQNSWADSNSNDKWRQI